MGGRLFGRAAKSVIINEAKRSHHSCCNNAVRLRPPPRGALAAYSAALHELFTRFFWRGDAAARQRFRAAALLAGPPSPAGVVRRCAWEIQTRAAPRLGVAARDARPQLRRCHHVARAAQPDTPPRSQTLQPVFLG